LALQEQLNSSHAWHEFDCARWSSLGRRPTQPDDNEIILLRRADKLNLATK
jgi:hypothetical protein